MMTPRHGSLVLALISFMVTDIAGAQTVTFQLIDGGLTARDVSPDGRYIVGAADQDGNGFQDGTYILDTVTNILTILPPEGTDATAVSDDGSVVLGCMPDPDDGVEVAGMWTLEGGWQSLGWLPNSLNCPSRSNGYELSGDGTIATGLSWDGCSGRGFWWSEDTGMLELEPLANGGNRSSVISADGSVAGGFAQGSFSRTPTRWDGVTTDGILLDPPDGDAVGEVQGISDDGEILLGNWEGEAFMWTEKNGMETIGSGSVIPSWTGIAMDIADNGVIIGFDTFFQSRRAWIKPTPDEDLTVLATWVQNNGGTIPGGLNLDIVTRMSADGRVIVGHSFFQTAWMITIETCDADVDGDNTVGINDLLLLLGAWGGNGPGADIAEPFDVADINDLLGMLGSWGPCS